MKKLWNNPLFRFVVFAFSLYIFWFLIYDNWLQPNRTIDTWVIVSIIDHVGLVLKLFGFESGSSSYYGPEIRTIGIVGSDEVWIGDSCNGIKLFALFTGFVLAYPGSIIKKLWYIPFGIITIHILNVLRVVALTIIVKYYPEALDFNHTYTFTILVYSYVFVLWYLWANKLSDSVQKG